MIPTLVFGGEGLEPTAAVRVATKELYLSKINFGLLDNTTFWALFSTFYNGSYASANLIRCDALGMKLTLLFWRNVLSATRSLSNLAK